jgi:hypothetical protein
MTNAFSIMLFVINIMFVHFNFTLMITLAITLVITLVIQQDESNKH